MARRVARPQSAPCGAHERRRPLTYGEAPEESGARMRRSGAPCGAAAQSFLNTSPVVSKESRPLFSSYLCFSMNSSS